MSIAVAPGHRFVYAVNADSNNISAFAVDATGALNATPQLFSTGSKPNSVAADASGRFLYVANGGSNEVSAYAIDAQTGALQPVAGSPFPSGGGPAAIAFDPSGRFAYVANGSSGDVQAFKAEAASGAMTLLFPAIAAGTNPNSVAVPPGVASSMRRTGARTAYRLTSSTRPRAR